MQQGGDGQPVMGNHLSHPCIIPQEVPQLPKVTCQKVEEGALGGAVRSNTLPRRSFPERSRDDGLYKMCGYATLP